jgi:hypothetical protein
MIRLCFILALLCLVACDPFDFGFKKNPAYVLEEALKAITNLDQQTFLEVCAREVLCIYGNEKGLQYLKHHLDIGESDVKIIPKILYRKSFERPVFVGYWSYYQERYEIEVMSKNLQKLILKTIVDCHYGFEGSKDQLAANLSPDQYKKKECRAVKLIPNTFVSLPLPQKCQKLRVDL